MVNFNANREAWQTVIANTSPMRPSVGKQVKVIEGKKHLGKIGIVRWHGADKFSDAWRYGDSAQHAMREIMGRYGYRVKVVTESGESFFISADRVEVILSDEPTSKPIVLSVVEQGRVDILLECMNDDLILLGLK